MQKNRISGFLYYTCNFRGGIEGKLNRSRLRPLPELLPFLLVLLVVFVLTYSFLKFICFFDKDILWVVFLYAILQNPGITLLKRGIYHGHFHVYNKIKRNFPPWKRNLMSSAGDSQEIPPSQKVVIANDWLKMTYLFNASNRKA